MGQADISGNRVKQLILSGKGTQHTETGIFIAFKNVNFWNSILWMENKQEKWLSHGRREKKQPTNQQQQKDSKPHSPSPKYPALVFNNSLSYYKAKAHRIMAFSDIIMDVSQPSRTLFVFLL